MLEAVTKDDKESLERLLRDRPDSWDITDKVSYFVSPKEVLFRVCLQNGSTLLHLAAGCGSQRCLLFLLSSGRSKVLVQDKVRFCVYVLVLCLCVGNLLTIVEHVLNSQFPLVS